MLRHFLYLVLNCICPVVRKNAIFTDEGDSFYALIRI